MVRRYIYLWFSIFRYSLSRDMEYKTNFIGNLFVDSIYYNSLSSNPWSKFRSQISIE